MYGTDAINGPRRRARPGKPPAGGPEEREETMTLAKQIGKLGGAALATVAAASIAQAQAVRIACPTSIPIYYLPVSVATGLDLFEKHGLDVEIVDLVGANAANALLSGS